MLKIFKQLLLLKQKFYFMIVPSQKRADMQENTKSNNGVLTVRSYDYKAKISELTPEERKSYIQVASSIDVNNTNSVQTYGSELSKAMSRCSDTVLSSVRSSGNDEIASLANELAAELQLIDVDGMTSESKVKQFLKRIPILRKMVQTVETTMVKYDTVAENVERISKKIDSTRMVALRDNNTLQTMFNSDKEYITQMRVYIIAAKLKLEELDAEIERMMTDPNCELYDIKACKNFRDSLEVRIADMEATELILTESLFQLQAISSGNDQLAQQADNMVNNVIPMWKNQLANAVFIANQKKNIEVQSKSREVFNETIRTNATNIRKSAVDIAKANSNAAIETNTLEHVTNELIQMVQQVNEVSQQKSDNCKKLENTIKESIEKLEKLENGIL